MNTSKTTTKDVLERTLALISTRDQWTQNESARDREGNPCAGGHRDAIRWCLIGAINRAAKHNYDLRRDAGDLIASKIRSRAIQNMYDLADYNDRTSHQRVVAAVERGLAACS